MMNDYGRVENPIRKIRPIHLTIGEKYPLRKLERVNSQYGEAILAGIFFEDEYCNLFLPQYFTRRYTDEDMNYMSCDIYDLIYEGPLGRSHKYQIRERDEKNKRVRPADLTQGVAYPLIRVQRITTMYGECLIALIMHNKTVGKLFLPKFFTSELNDMDLTEISGNAFYLFYEGPVGSTFKYRVEKRDVHDATSDSSSSSP